MSPSLRCRQCRDLEGAHDTSMERYIKLLEQQAVLFRNGQSPAAKDLGGELHRLKAQRQAAIDALLRHQAEHLVDTRARDGNYYWLRT